VNGQTAGTIGVDASTGRSRISCDRAVDQAPLAAEVNTAAAICGTVFCFLLAGKMLRQESHQGRVTGRCKIRRDKATTIAWEE
jgi:hypothetical protein